MMTTPNPQPCETSHDLISCLHCLVEGTVRDGLGGLRLPTLDGEPDVYFVPSTGGRVYVTITDGRGNAVRDLILRASDSLAFTTRRVKAALRAAGLAVEDAS